MEMVESAIITVIETFRQTLKEAGRRIIQTDRMSSAWIWWTEELVSVLWESDSTSPSLS